MNLSIVIPSYRRADHLRNCLRGLAEQSVKPDEVIVVYRPEDVETQAVISEFDVQPVSVDTPGLMAAIEAGVVETKGDIVALTDDDAVARPNWCRQIVDAFADPTVGALGGRDFVKSSSSIRETTKVGMITYWGNMIGNHHRATGSRRDVRVLKGVNMAYRREALSVPTNLRGFGAQPHTEVAICQWAHSKGWRIVLDPALAVDHYHAVRPEGDQRDQRTWTEARNEAFNLVYGIISFDRKVLVPRFFFGLTIGNGAVPGLARFFLYCAQQRWHKARLVFASLLGQIEAYKEVAQGRPVKMRELPQA